VGKGGIPKNDPDYDRIINDVIFKNINPVFLADIWDRWDERGMTQKELGLIDNSKSAHKEITEENEIKEEINESQEDNNVESKERNQAMADMVLSNIFLTVSDRLFGAEGEREPES